MLSQKISESFCARAHIPVSNAIRTALKEDLYQADKMLMGILAIHWLVASTLMAYSYGFYWLGFISGGLITGTAYVGYLYLRGTLYLRLIMAVSLMLFSAIFIQQHLGRIEMHFHVFLAMPILIRYKDVLPIFAAALTIILHHLVFNYCQEYNVSLFGTPLLVYNYGQGLTITLLHGAFVAIAAAIYMFMIRDNMQRFCGLMYAQGENIRMGAELDITRRLQTMLLPKETELEAIKNLDIAYFMQPAAEVGGDYLDVLRQGNQVKIGIGDVTGHGLESGILMLMVQTAVRTLLTHKVSDPKLFLNVINKVVYHNMQRICSDKNLSLTLLDYEAGLLRLSGQHEETLIVRKEGHIERIDTFSLGFMVGVEEEISDFVQHLDIELAPGDGVVLYTDGLTEAFSPLKTVYGIERLCTLISQNWQRSSAKELETLIIQDVYQHMGEREQLDDITLIIMKQLD